MTITAMVSGQAGLGLIREPNLELRSADGDHRVGASLSSMLRTFDGCTDLRLVSGKTIADIDNQILLAWASDRALQLLLLLLDPQEPQDERKEYAVCVEELLEVGSEVRRFLRNRLMSAPLPVSDRDGWIAACRDSAEVLEIVEDVSRSQAYIKVVCLAFDALPLADFHNDRLEKAGVREALVRRGAFSDIVTSLARGENLNFRRLELMHAFPVYQAAIASWLETLSPGSHAQRPVQHEEEDETEWLEFESVPAAGRVAYEQAKAQINHIVQMLDERNLDAARRLTDELIRSQRANSSSEHIAKSLCNLAMQAKKREVVELQLEWSEWAVRENPVDHMTHGHLADALIVIGRLDEAEKSIDEVENTGDRLFAESARARILNAKGHPDLAREKLLSVAAEFDNHPDVDHTYIAAADTLRDMGLYHEALNEFEELTERFPLQPLAWEGLATVQMDLGDFDNAIKTFGKAIANTRAMEVQARHKNGRALALRWAGRFDEAHQLYDEVIAILPNNGVALTGKGAAFREAGKYDAAITAYDTAIDRCPYSPFPIAGKAKVLRDLGHFAEAAKFYAEGRERFPHDQSLVSGTVALLRAQGKYGSALEFADHGIQQFPYNVELQLARAALLGIVGKCDEALTIYDRLLESRAQPGRTSAAKAALLLRLERFDEARQLLPEIRPRSQSDWARVLLRAMLIQRTKGHGAAAGVLVWGMRACPFARYRRLLRSALVNLELQRNRPKDARRIVEESPTQVSNVIALHAYAASHRPGAARAHYKQILEGEQPAELIELATEIARRHGLVDGPARRSPAWIRETEFEMIVREAA